MGTPSSETRRDERPTESLEIQPGQIYARAEQLAHRFGVTVKLIRARKGHLGATPISDSANSKLRYHVPTADAYMDARKPEPTMKTRRSPRRKPNPSSIGGSSSYDRAVQAFRVRRPASSARAAAARPVTGQSVCGAVSAPTIQVTPWRSVSMP